MTPAGTQNSERGSSEKKRRSSFPPPDSSFKRKIPSNGGGWVKKLHGPSCFIVNQSCSTLEPNIQKMKIMVSCPITSWQIDGETMETVTDFIFFFFWPPKSLKMVTAAMKLKRHMLLGRKAVTYLDSLLKSRDITLPTKVCLVKAMVFPVVTYGCESWTLKKVPEN